MARESILKFDTNAIMSKINRAIERSHVIVVDKIVTALKKSINIPFPPASLRGRPPRRRTGNLRMSVKRRRINKRSIGINALLYGKFLERGTVIMDARPWVRPILFGDKRKWAREFQKEFKRIMR